MRQLRLTNGFEQMSDANLAAKSLEIDTGITAHPDYFKDPIPSLEVFRNTRTSFTDAMAKAAMGGSYEKAIRDQKKAELVEVLHSLGIYVLFTANGDEAIATASKFSIAKTPSPAPPVTAAQNCQTEDGPNSGEVMFRFERVAGAKSYVYQVVQDPITTNSVWKTYAGTVKKNLFTELESAKKHWFRVMAIGSNGQGVYSDPVSRVVQ